jgi:hypothetical protein
MADRKIRILRFEILNQIVWHWELVFGIYLACLPCTSAVQGLREASPCLPVGGVEGHNQNDISFQGSPGLWPESFTFGIWNFETHPCFG